MRSEFFILRTKDEYYADVDTKIKMYEDFMEKHEGTPYAMFAQMRLKELNKEKFLQED